MYKDLLKEARQYLKANGKTEYHLTDEHQANELFDQLQAVRAELNKAKVEAMRKVSAEFDDKLNEIEELYSSYLRMIA